MRIFYATDLHGSEVCFRKFVNAGKHYEADMIICGGDITGKMLVPIVKQPDGTFNATLFGQKVSAKNDEELQQLQKNVRNAGFYYTMTNVEEFSSFDQKKVNEIFESEMLRILRQWVQLAEERLKSTGIKCLMMPGNDDIFEVDEVLASSDYVQCADGKVLKFDQFEIMTLGYSNMTPWKCVRDISEEEFTQKIDELASRVENIDRCIFNIHCPPYDSEIDFAPELDQNFKPKLQGGELKMIPVGSTAVRKAIEKYQPLLGLHGHIHESKGVTKIGKTLAINPGSDYQQNQLRGVVIDLNKHGKINWTLTAG